MLFVHLILVFCYLYIAIHLDRKVHKVERILEELLEELKSIDENEELKNNTNG